MRSYPFDEYVTRSFETHLMGKLGLAPNEVLSLCKELGSQAQGAARADRDELLELIGWVEEQPHSGLAPFALASVEYALSVTPEEVGLTQQVTHWIWDQVQASTPRAA